MQVGSLESMYKVNNGETPSRMWENVGKQTMTPGSPHIRGQPIRVVVLSHDRDAFFSSSQGLPRYPRTLDVNQEFATKAS